jgi:small-conductance mechanosensitive channel
MQIPDPVFLGNPLRSWLIATAIAVAVTLGLRLIEAVLVRRLRRISEHTKNDFDDIAVNVLDNTKFYFLLFLGVWAGSRSLVLSEQAARALKIVGVVIVALQVGAWASVAVDAFIKRRIRKTREADPAEATTMAALGFLIRLLLWSVLLLAALSNLGIEIAPLIAGLGVGGVAVALAVQSVLGDLFASLSIVLDKPFVIGDFIVVDDLAGTIENVGLKTTRVRSLSGEQLVFSNSDLLGSRIRNFKRMYERRILFTIGVTYNTPREMLARIPVLIRSAVEEQQEKARFDRSHFKDFGDSSLNFETVYYVLVPDYNTYMDVQQSINLELVRQFESLGIEFAFPTRTLYVEGAVAMTRAKQNGTAGDGERDRTEAAEAAEAEEPATSGDGRKS